MPSWRKIPFQGQLVDAEVVEFEADKEVWSVYILHDGTTLKLKPVVTEVLKLSGVFSPNGDPAYVIQATQVLTTNSPETLRRKS